MLNTNKALEQHRIPQAFYSQKPLQVNLSKAQPTVLFVTSYPPRECGIATYSQDLIIALKSKFNKTYDIEICVLLTETELQSNIKKPKYSLDTTSWVSFIELAKSINMNNNICLVVIQHEFGFFELHPQFLIDFLKLLAKPAITVFHTVLPLPSDSLKQTVLAIADSTQLVVMTNFSKKILLDEYALAPEKVTVIEHGTHLVPHISQTVLKQKYGFVNRKVLVTFGLLSAGKNIESTLLALPDIIAKHPEVIFIIMGKTHPSVLKTEGELYRNKLEALVTEQKLENHVCFVNKFVPLDELLENLQMADIYIFTSKDRHQAVSGTFSYAISCGCPIISTSIPHAIEVIGDDAGVLIDFENSPQITKEVNRLLADDSIRLKISTNGLHRMASTAWENSANAHATLFATVANKTIKLKYNMPPINLDHLKKMTTDFGIIQFANINEPDNTTGYTLDDNARALVAMCQYFEITKDIAVIPYISIYLDFITFCLLPEGYFLNYVDYDNHNFTEQNFKTNLADSNGRAIWALGYLMSIEALLPTKFGVQASKSLNLSLSQVYKIHSTRAMSFIIKGLYYAGLAYPKEYYNVLIVMLADRLTQMYKHESDAHWSWYESYFTYANSVMPEALLCAYLSTGDPNYKKLAKSSFDFLLSKIYEENGIHVVSNRGWTESHAAQAATKGGEQPIDVAYTILALKKFFAVFKENEYLNKMEIAFNWFLGHNHLNQIIYNPCTGGCYDGLEENNVNLNQGAESTVSYLMARLAVHRSLGILRDATKHNYILDFDKVNVHKPVFSVM